MIKIKLKKLNLIIRAMQFIAICVLVALLVKAVKLMGAY